MQTKLCNALNAELAVMTFALRIFSFAFLSFCLLLSGCNPKSEEKAEDEAEQAEAQEEENTNPAEAESDKTVEGKSESADQDKTSESKTNRSNAESSESAAKSSTQTATSSTPSKNGVPEINFGSPEASVGYSIATGLRNRAAAYAKKGDSKSAYQTTLAAWEAVRDEKNNKQCQELSTELLQDLEKYGEGLRMPVIENVLKKPVRYE